MRAFLFVFALFFSSSAICSSNAPLRTVVGPVADLPSFEFDAVPLSDLVRLVYLQAYPEISYTLDPQLLQDKRLVSFRWTPNHGNFRDVFIYFLRSLGYSLLTRNKLDFITVFVPQSAPSVVEG